MNYLIIVSTVNCFLEYLAPIAIKFIIMRLCTTNKSDMSLRTDLLDLKQEMASISIVDEFSKFARLQRKYIKLESELKEKVNAQISSRMKIRLFVTYLFKILNGLVTLVLLYLYNSEPVVILPKNTLWPFQSFFKWPCHHEDAISLTVWIIIWKDTWLRNTEIRKYNSKKVDVFRKSMSKIHMYLENIFAYNNYNR